MTTRKRLASLFLAVCLVLPMTVPAVWAEKETGVITRSFGTGSKEVSIDISHSNYDAFNGYTQYAPNTQVDINANVKYLNQSASNKDRANNDKDTPDATKGCYYPNRAWSLEKYTFAGFFGETDVTAKQWIAFQINDITAGTYDMTFTKSGAKVGGVFQVYVLDKDKYVATITDTEVIGENSLGAETVLSEQNNINIYNALSNNGAILNDIDEVYKLDCSIKGEHSIGNVTFEKNEGKDDYVLLFQISGKGTDSSAQDNAYSLNISSLTLTPVETEETVEAKIGDAAYATVEKAIENAQSGDEIDLQAAAEVDEIAIPAGVTLDLNGYTLTAKSLTCFGTGIVKDSTDGTGSLAVENAKLNTDGQLPLTDNNVYRFFDVTVEKLGITNKVMNGEALSSGKFWFRVSFNKDDAYALAKDQMIIGAGLSGTGIPADTNAKATKDFTAKWVDAVNSNEPSHISFTAKNLDSVSDFELTPMVTANDVTVSGDAL